MLPFLKQNEQDGIVDTVHTIIIIPTAQDIKIHQIRVIQTAPHPASACTIKSNGNIAVLLILLCTAAAVKTIRPYLHQRPCDSSRVGIHDILIHARGQNIYVE